MFRWAIVVVLLAGCASTGPRHLRPLDSVDRKIAFGSYMGGGLIAFGGCVAGFAGAGPVAFPICIGGWAFGISSIGYLVLDDSLREKSYAKTKELQGAE